MGVCVSVLKFYRQKNQKLTEPNKTKQQIMTSSFGIEINQNSLVQYDS